MPLPLRILIYAMGSAGDVHPFAGIGRVLLARGHEVFVITSPYFEDVVRGGGLEFRPMGSVADFERVQADPHLWHPTKALPSIIRNAVDPSYGPILDHARELHLPGRTVILASSLGWGALVARELLGIPVASVHLAPALFISSQRQPVLHGAPVPQWAPGWMKSLQWWAAEKVVDFHVLPALNRFRRSHGLPPVRGMLHHWHSPDRVIALFPAWFGAPQADWPAQTRSTGFPMFDEKGQRELPPGLAEFLAAGEPPVVFTPGSAMSQGRRFFEEAAGALKRSGRRGILLSRFADTIPAVLPAGVRHFSYIPFSQLLPKAAALVHHGGVGTCAQALQAGIPQLVQPMAHDQLDNLSRVRELGVGCGLHPHQFKAQRIAALLDRLLHDPALKARAVAVSKRFDPAAWVEQTCRLVEALAPRAASAR